MGEQSSSDPTVEPGETWVGVIPQTQLDLIGLMWALQPPDLKLVPWLHRQADSDPLLVLALTGYMILTGVTKNADGSVTISPYVSRAQDSLIEIAQRTEDLAGGLRLSAAQIDARLGPAADGWFLTRQRVDEDFVSRAQKAHHRLLAARDPC